MNCDRCPHMRSIKKALNPCQTCEAGRLHGEIHVDGWASDKSHLRRETAEVTRTECVTRLSREDEDALRVAMATLFGMSAIDLMLVWHMMRGGRLAGYVDALGALDRKIRSIRGNPRAFANEVKNRVIRTMPALEPVLRGLIGTDQC